MRRAFFACVLAFSICFQGIALAGQVVTGDRCGDAAHAMLHSKAVPHHHHARDGTIHKDQSEKSKQHVQDHCCASVAGIPPSIVRAVQLPQQGSRSAAAEPGGHDSAFIEGLKRPPRMIA